MECLKVTETIKNERFKEHLAVAVVVVENVQSHYH
jgi:hypothetical protein